MATLTNLIGRGTDHSTTVLAALSTRFGFALHRSVCERYIEQCEKVARTGLAGMI